MKLMRSSRLATATLVVSLVLGEDSDARAESDEQQNIEILPFTVRISITDELAFVRRFDLFCFHGDCHLTVITTDSSSCATDSGKSSKVSDRIEAYVYNRAPDGTGDFQITFLGPDSVMLKFIAFHREIRLSAQIVTPYATSA